MDKHYLIVGAGLSGVCVAVQLLKRDVKVTLFDNKQNHSSIIAAGMINPLVFRRMTKSWRVDEFMPYLKSFYADLENVSGGSFFHSIPVRRLFSSEQEKDSWLKKESRSDFAPYMHPISKEDDQYNEANNEFGTGRVKETYYVDVHPFFNYMKAWLKEKCTLIEGTFDHEKLIGNTYENTAYDGVIFCAGHLNETIPWFKDVPIHPTKGQTITIRTDQLPESHSVNRKCFVLPRGNHLFKIGATYEWHNNTINATEEGRMDLLNNLKYIVDKNVEVVDQEAGVRPTVVDRRPTIGTHPEIKSYHIFNGLGAKGYMIAPFLSLEFVNFLLDGTPLDKEVRIERFLNKNT